jgi:cytochrome c553
MKSHYLAMGLIAAMGAPIASRAADVIVEATSAGAQTAARQVAVSTCANCHGRQGRSIAPKFPVLAGQHAPYVAAQLHAFKAQTRGDPDAIGYMWGMSAPLDDEMINALAAYYAAQTPAPGPHGDPAMIARGADIYAKGIASDGIPPCAGCHGANGAGTDQFPRLAGQHAQYLLKQLRSFQSNLRDVAVMHGVAQGMAIGEMEAVATYLESLGGA